MSAHTEMELPFDTNVVINEKEENRGTWKPRVLYSWYFGPAIDHY